MRRKLKYVGIAIDDEINHKWSIVVFFSKVRKINTNKKLMQNKIKIEICGWFFERNETLNLWYLAF